MEIIWNREIEDGAGLCGEDDSKLKKGGISAHTRVIMSCVKKARILRGQFEFWIVIEFGLRWNRKLQNSKI